MMDRQIYWQADSMLWENNMSPPDGGGGGGGWHNDH